jgi:hypothetical protein
MPDFDNYLGQTALGGIDIGTRAVRAWLRIQDKPTSITVARGDADLDAQTVRLEWQSAREAQGGAGEAGIRQLVIFGVQDHPDGDVVDTDLARGDRFRHDGANFNVVDVVTYPGEIQAFAERIT